MYLVKDGNTLDNSSSNGSIESRCRVRLASIAPMRVARDPAGQLLDSSPAYAGQLKAESSM